MSLLNYRGSDTPRELRPRSIHNGIPSTTDIECDPDIARPVIIFLTNKSEAFTRATAIKLHLDAIAPIGQCTTTTIDGHHRIEVLGDSWRSRNC